MKKIYLIAFILLGSLVLRAQSLTYTNSTSIIIADNSTATIYSSNVTVAGAPATISSIGVIINNFSHGAPGDVAIAIQSPSGQSFLLQEGFWGSTPASGVTYLLSDIGATQPGVWSLPASGTYKPAGYNTPLTSFDAPGPGTVYANPGPAGAGTATLTSTFAGQNPNGLWRLWVLDVASGSSGTISGGWSLVLNPATPLPVELSDFKAVCVSSNQQIEVSWITHNEENTKSFVLQSSSDGTFFNDVKELNAAGNSNMEMKYSVLIPREFEKQFVRMKSEDLNGQFTYSPVLEVTCNTNVNLSVKPNPFGEAFELNNPNGDFVQYEVSDVNGRIILSGKTNSIRERINLQNQSNGIYNLRATRNNQVENIKLQKL